MHKTLINSIPNIIYPRYWLLIKPNAIHRHSPNRTKANKNGTHSKNVCVCVCMSRGFRSRRMQDFSSTFLFWCARRLSISQFTLLCARWYHTPEQNKCNLVRFGRALLQTDTDWIAERFFNLLRVQTLSRRKLHYSICELQTPHTMIPPKCVQQITRSQIQLANSFVHRKRERTWDAN